MLRAALVAVSLSIGGAASAQSAQDLQDAAQAVERAAPGRARRDALAEAVQAHDAAAAGLRAEVRELALREGALKQVLAAQQDDIGALLAGLQRIPPHGAQTLLVHPSGALAAARAGMVLTGAVPPLQAKLRTLSERVAEVSALHRKRADLERQLANAAAQARELRARLITDHGQRGTAETTAQAIAIATALRQGAADISETTQTETAVALDLPLPVAGEVVSRFGDPRPGLVLATEPGALVSAPLAMTVRFAGQLSGYGSAMVLEPAPGRLLILTGLGTLLSRQGEVVTRGSPLGFMPETAQFGDMTSQTDTFAAKQAEAAGTGRRESLYIETREADMPVDPLTWFAERKDTR